MNQKVCGVVVQYDTQGRCCFMLNGTRYRGERRGVFPKRQRWVIYESQSDFLVWEGPLKAFIQSKVTA